MRDKYIVFDLETPNSANNRISAIGITVVSNGIVIDEAYTLVDPETHFDNFNIHLTGITPKAVSGKPTFPELWQTIEPIMGSGLLIAHNAHFDMSVLAKCFNYYNIGWHPFTYYACTCAMGRACYPALSNHKLSTLCNYLGIELNHHNAASDSRACAELLIDYIDHGISIDSYQRKYDLKNARAGYKTVGISRNPETRQLLELKNILQDIIADGVLSDKEIYLLQGWLDNASSLKCDYPFNKVFMTIGQALEDGYLDNHEIESMINLFGQIIDPVSNTCTTNDINIVGKIFCLTGEFTNGRKSFIGAALSRRGGILTDSVTKNTDLLIVGSKGSDAWSAGNYGNKVRKALEMQEKGHPIKIIKEEDIVASLIE